MRLSSSLHSPIVPHFSDRGSPRRRTVKIRRDGIHRCIGVRAATRDDERTDGNDGSDGQLVDSDLPALRRRIREVGSRDKGGIVLPLSNRVISVGTQYRRAIFESEACQVRAAVRLDPASAPPTSEEGRERRRRPPRLEIGVTVTVSVFVPVPVLVIMLYVVDVAQGVLDLMHHQDTNEEDC
uniref:Uncharacterized protein n=1 Tax=Ananas comosus var. bracteatus TaxID=296719 RepID=A0A6V7Q595_ANACO|nr:unnamed protein product [Ananas comosus var. bracteatus]